MTMIQVDFRDYRTTHNEMPIYYPGDRVSGQVVITPDRTVTCRNVRVEVGWYTTGKGNRDKETLEKYVIDVQQLEPGVPIAQRFAAELPMMPYSFSGQLINIIWAVQVTVDIAMRGDITGSRAFVLRPPEKSGVDSGG